MERAVVYVLTAAAFALFFVFPPSKSRDRNHHGLTTRRLGYKFRNPNFDPLVAEMERNAEESGLGSRESAIGVGKTAIPDDYRRYHDGEKLNISLRLLVLFPLLDKSPKNGAISYEELGDWVTGQAIDRLNYRTRKQLEFSDKNGDGAISFHEYLPQFTEEDIARNGTEHGEAGWWKRQFTNADVDSNGLLNFDELKESMDNDRDGKLNFDEFLHHAYNTYRNYIEFETQGDNVPSAKEKFDELDLDGDKLLTVDELRPLFQYFNPGELSHAQHYTSHLFNEADDNKDGNLTLDEMLNNENVFYSTIYDNHNGNYEDDYRDEL